MVASDAAPLADVDVPDPWYGGIDDFVETLEILEDATDNILDHARLGLGA